MIVFDFILWKLVVYQHITLENRQPYNIDVMRQV